MVILAVEIALANAPELDGLISERGRAERAVAKTPLQTKMNAAAMSWFAALAR